MPLKFPYLFSPVKLGDITIENRCVMAPINNGLLSPDETWPLQTIRYYEERSIGGCGLIITGACCVNGRLAGIPKVGIYNRNFIPSHKKLVDRVHRYDTKIFCQLTLNGGKVGKEAPSSIYNPAYPVRPRELTTGEVDGLVEDFITSAGYARESGYDGVEIHGGHTYLVGAFMSPSTNKRKDKYGGSFDRRMKFPSDIVMGIAKEYSDFPVGIKFSVYEELPEGIDISLGLEIAEYLTRLKPVYLHVSTTSSSIEIKSRYPSVPHMYAPRNTLMPLAEKVKKVCPDVPVIGTGAVVIPEDAERFISTGACDMVALGRAVLADPYWPQKARDGKTNTITPCIRCNVCYRQLWHSEPLCCSMNPYLSHEAEQRLTPTDNVKKVIVAGAGPAGIRCALTASKRGHNVVLYEKMPYIGGLLYPGSRPEFKEDIRRALEWYETKLAESSVTVKLNTVVTPELVENETPDALVIAIGANLIIPDIPGIDNPQVVSAIEVLTDVTKFSGRKAAVVGGGEVGCETACHLADNGFMVTLVSRNPRLMKRSDNNTRNAMMLLLEDRPVTVIKGIPVTAIYDDGIEICLPNGKRWGIEVDLVVFALGVIAPDLAGHSPGPAMKVSAKNGMPATLAMKAEEVYIIGNCSKIGLIREATKEGELVGRWL